MVKSFQMYSLMVVFLILIVLSCSSNLRQNSSLIVKDVDGNRYRIVKIGDQWWMAENLKVKHYRNGDPIPNVTDSSEWRNLSTGAYCVYDNIERNSSNFSFLYNWFAVKDNRSIAPKGWHVPSDEEWTQLVEFLGTNGGSKMKISQKELPLISGSRSTNESGFSSLLGGHRNLVGEYETIGILANFWSFTEKSKNEAWSRSLLINTSDVGHFEASKEFGYSVRCIKDCN